MRVPIEWLREYVAFEDTVQGLADKLTFSGIEVEGIEQVGHAYDGVVVAEVRAVERHPNADRLTVCRVFDGTRELQVVCGAPNVRPGLRCPFAGVGATLPNGLTLKAAKLRGVESFGMLCAEDELGLSDNHDGLMELTGPHPAGTPFREVVGGPDTVLDLEITPNRPDCLCLIGIAREVAALYHLPLRRPEVRLSESAESVDALVQVRIEDPRLCPRYTARVLSGLRIAPSPAWMQDRLTRAGVRPINNVVDVTNYVMLESGHPLHAFDRALLKGSRITVRPAREGEVLRTLDNRDRPLTSSQLVIADEAGPVALAGVMGGAGSEIRDTTVSVLLESAGFEKSGIRATSRGVGLATESSHRFARGVDPAGAEWASRRAAALMVELAGGACARGVVDAYPAPVAPRTVRARLPVFSRMLGMPCAPEDIVRTLTALELEAVVRDDVLEARVPTFRNDLQIEVDLVEEYARISGLDRIPCATPTARIAPGADDRRARLFRAVRDQLAGLGLQEIMNYSLTAPALLERFGLLDDTCIRLPNPLSEEQSVLRPSLLPQVTETLGRNRARQVSEAAVCEFGRTYRQRPGAGVREVEALAVGLMGAAGRGVLRKRAAVEPEEMIQWVKGVVEHVLRDGGIGAWSWRASTAPAFLPGTVLDLVIEGEAAGRAGLLDPRLAGEWRIYEPVGLAELDLARLLNPDARRKVQPVPPPPYPSSTRDIAFVADCALTHAQIEDVIRAAAPAGLEQVALFDVYQGRSIGRGRRSLAYSLTYRSSSRTLTDSEVNEMHQAVVDALKNRLGVEIRDAAQG